MPAERGTPSMMQERRVLVAEDNAALAAVIRINLARAGLNVTMARDGGEAWRLLQAGEYSLVLTDQQMPVLQGSELCALMRQHARYADTPVILLTAKGLEMELETLRRELGVRELIAKPFSPRELVQRVLQYFPEPDAPLALNPAFAVSPALQPVD